MQLTSKSLMDTQEVLEQLSKNEIDAPMSNYRKIARLNKVIEEIDSLRRKTWHDEMFGEHEEVANNILAANFNSDDIPF